MSAEDSKEYKKIKLKLLLTRGKKNEKSYVPIPGVEPGPPG